MTLKKKHLALWIPRLFMISICIGFVMMIPTRDWPDIIFVTVILLLCMCVFFGIINLAVWCGYHSDDESPVFTNKKEMK